MRHRYLSLSVCMSGIYGTRYSVHDWWLRMAVDNNVFQHSISPGDWSSCADWHRWLSTYCYVAGDGHRAYWTSRGEWINPLKPTAAVCHMLPFLTFGHSDAQSWASEWPDVKNYKWRLNPVWHRMLYNCTHMATVGFKGLNVFILSLVMLWCFWQKCFVSYLKLKLKNNW